MKQIAKQYFRCSHGRCVKIQERFTRDLNFVRGGRDPQRGGRREGQIPRDLAPGEGEITRDLAPGGTKSREGEIPGTPVSIQLTPTNLKQHVPRCLAALHWTRPTFPGFSPNKEI